MTETTTWAVVRDAIDSQPRTSDAGDLASAVLNELSAAGYSIIRSEVVEDAQP